MIHLWWKPEKLNIFTCQIFGIGINISGEADCEGVVHYCNPLGCGIVNVFAMMQMISDIPAAVGRSMVLAAILEKCLPFRKLENIVWNFFS